MKYSFLLIILLSLGMTSAKDRPAYQIFNKKGKKADFSTMMQAAGKADVVLFGEIHNNTLVHWLQLQVSKELLNNGPVVMGAEMFETDDQLVVNEYLQGTIQERHFENEAKLWNNYQTDYKPLIQFAQTHQVPFIATNIPRRYASLVARKGTKALDSLSSAAKKYFAPLPLEVDYELPGYQNMMSMMGNGMGHSGGGMDPKNFVNAQAIKDATMAWSINNNLGKEAVFLHLNGSYHSDNYEGIYWYLKKLNEELDIITISSVEQSDIGQLDEEHRNKADFIICTPADMAKSY